MTSRGRLDLLIRRLRRVAEPTADGATDASLLERFVAGRDEAAFELLLWRHGPMVLGLCRRMLRREQDAEDAFQATFLLLARKAASVRRGEAVAGWLYRTAYRIALRARQTARLRPVAIPPGMEPAASTSEPEVVWRDLRPVLDDEIHRLPAKYRLPIILCYFQGRTHAEAALELGCPKGTVSVRLQRARELLRGRLTRRGLAPYAGTLAVLTAGRAAPSAVPAVLVHGTLKAAILFATGKAVVGAASVRAVAWTHGVLRAMILSKLKLLATVVLTAATATGAGFLLSRTTAAPPRPPADPPPAVQPTQDAKTAKETPDEPDKPLVKGTAEVSSEQAGTLLVVGTDELGDSPNKDDLVTIRVPFLALQIDAKDPKNPVDPSSLPPESEWLFLVKAPDSRFREACGPTRLGDLWDQYKKNQSTPIYRRWHEGDPLHPDKVEMVIEKKTFRKLHEGETVQKGQLLALLDMTVQVNDVASKIAKLETAEYDYTAAGKTKEEASRRAIESQKLFEKGGNFISKDTYYADLLNRDRYIEEEKAKDAARRVAGEELSASLSLLKMCEIRSGDKGVVLAILKRRGEAVHNLEPIVRLEVDEAAGTGPRRTPAPIINVPSQRDGVLLVVGTEIKEGEKIPANRIVTVKRNGRATTYRRLREGDAVEEGQLLARVDDRLARIDLDVARSKLDGAMADLRATAKTKEEANRRYQLDARSAASVPEATLSTDKLNAERYAEEEKSKAAAVRVAEAEVAEAQAVLEMCEIRSPVRGTVKAFLKSRGEAVKSLETVVVIQPKE